MEGKGYFKADDKFAAFKVAKAVSDTMEAAGLRFYRTGGFGLGEMRERPVVVMCIGTDRSTGDSLGPLVGDMLTKWRMPDVQIYGTLDLPVHAKNLEDITQKIRLSCPNAYILAVDASLGVLDHVGCITVGQGSIKPGAGLKKELPAVGDMHITGVVNTGGFMDFLVLQSTRLSVVMRMADVIARGIHMSVNEFSTRSGKEPLPLSRLQ